MMLMQTDDKHSIKDLLDSISKITSDIKNDRPNEIDDILTLALDHGKLITTLKSKKIMSGLNEAIRYLDDFKNKKETRDPLEILREKKLALWIIFLSKIVGAIVINILIFLWLFAPNIGVVANVIEAGTISNAKIDSQQLNEFHAFIYFLTCFGWYAGGWTAYFFRVVREYQRKSLWDLAKCTVIGVFWLIFWPLVGWHMSSWYEWLSQTEFAAVASIMVMIKILTPIFILSVPIAFYLELRKRLMY